MKLARLAKYLIPVYFLFLLLLTSCAEMFQDMENEIMRQMLARLNPFYFLTGGASGGPPVTPQEAAATGAVGAIIVGIATLILNHLSTAATTLDTSFINSNVDARPSETPGEAEENPEDGTEGDGSGTDPETEVNPPETLTSPDHRISSIYDPLSQQSLVVDEKGNVLYNGVSIPAEQALENIRINQEFLEARNVGTGLVNGFKDTVSQLEAADAGFKEQLDKIRQLQEQLKNTTDPEAAEGIQKQLGNQVDELKNTLKGFENSEDPAVADLAARLREQSNQMNANYSSKNVLKGEGRTAAGTVFDSVVHNTYSQVDQEFATRLNEMGYRRGGHEFTAEDLMEFRNKSSQGTVGQDRDAGLNEEACRDLLDKMEQAPPGSEEANKIARQLQEAHENGRITVDPEKQVAYLRRQIVETDSKLTDLKSQLESLPGDSPEVAGIRAEIARLSQRPGELQREVSQLEDRATRLKETYINQLQQKLERAVPGSSEAQTLTREIDNAGLRLAGRAELDVSPGRWNEVTAPEYNRAFSDTTGTDARSASQLLTNNKNVEAYPDARILREELSDPRWAAQNAAVPQVKAIENQANVGEGIMVKGEAIQETARGYSKDIVSKIIKQLEQDPNVTPERMEVVTKINRIFKDIGDGTLFPGDANAELQHRLPEIKDLTIEKATRILDANYESSIKYQGTGVGATGTLEETTKVTPTTEPGFVHQTWGRVNDLAAVEGYYQQNAAYGMSEGEALTVAAGQTLAGNRVMAMDHPFLGSIKPEAAILAGAMLPGGTSNILPDQAIANLISTSDLAGHAITQTVNDSLASGQLDTQALDKFVDNLNQRPGVDPFKGINQASELGFEELYRTDGGNIIKDVLQINDSGAGSEVINESLEGFRQSIAAPLEGEKPQVILQGWDHLFRSASEVVVDPAQESQSLINDMGNMYNYGVGDGYWTECLGSTAGVIKELPVIDKVVDGYSEIYNGVANQGVAGFSQEMYEGGRALAGETASAVGDAVAGTYNYIKSFF